MTTIFQKTPPQIGVTLPAAAPANADQPILPAEQQPASLSSFWRNMAESPRFDGDWLIDAAFNAGERAVRELAADSADSSEPGDSVA